MRFLLSRKTRDVTEPRVASWVYAECIQIAEQFKVATDTVIIWQKLQRNRKLGQAENEARTSISATSEPMPEDLAR
jgi:hypothetical protein